MRRLISVVIVLLLVNVITACSGQKQNKVVDVVVVGGGFSGLIAAYNISDKDVLVLEKEDVPGGRCLSGSWNGFHYPKGTEYIGKPEDGISKLLKELGIKAEKIPAPTDGVAYNGKFYFGKNLLGYLSKKEQKQYAKLSRVLLSMSEDDIEDVIFSEQEYLNEYKDLDKISVKDWMDKKGYATLIQKFVDVENRGLFGTDNSNYSMFFNIPEMAFDIPLVSTIDESVVYSFSHGMYSIVEKLATKLGDRMMTGACVNEVKVNKDKTVSVSYVRDGKKHTVIAKSVIMATPAPITGRIVSNYLSPKVLNTLLGIQYSQYATINFFTKKRFLKDAWSVSCIDEGQVVTLYDVIKPQVEKDYDGKSILSVYMAPKNAYDRTFVKQTNERILQNAYKTLNRYYPGFEKDVIGHDITRFDYAFPIFSPNYISKINTLISDKTLNGPIFLAGDYMVYATVDGAVISAENAAEKVNKYLAGDNN